MKRLCVYCGSSSDVSPAYVRAAKTLGMLMAGSAIELVYGGGNVGLMGVVADAVLQQGGKVTGVIPQSLVDKEVAHFKITTLEVVDSMHERKKRMADLADGFLALPGGIGTMEELFEILTWAQLGLHHKPCGLLNVAGYYDHLLGFLDHMTAEKFLRPAQLEYLLVETDPEVMLNRIAKIKPPAR